MARQNLTITVLGSGSSGGVPRIGNDWGACDPRNPKNRRTRCSLLVQRGAGAAKTNILIDTSPDMREQLLHTDIKHLDGVLFTHDHADQTHGIDDLRQLALAMGRRVDVHGDAPTLQTLSVRFGYCFAAAEGSNYPPILNAHLIAQPFREFQIAGPGGPIAIRPFEQYHGQTRSLGFRFGAFAYSSDVVGFPPESLKALEGVETWVVDALRYRPHPSHAHVALALEWIAQIRPKRAILTDLHVDIDYATLAAELPSGVEPAYDGMTFEV